MDVAARADGSPVIVYVREWPDAAQYRYATWQRGRWRDRAIAVSGRIPGRRSYPGGATLDHEDPRVVFLSEKIGSHFEVEAWATADGGRTWVVDPLTSASSRCNVRPVSVLGGSTVLWMAGEYAHAKSYDTRIIAAQARAKAAAR